MKRFIFILFQLISILSYAQVKEAPFSQKTLEPINEIIKNRFVGRTESFEINEYLALYSVNSQYMVCSNLRTNKTNSIRLQDSLLYALIYNKEQVAEIDEKMVLHKAKIEEFGTKASDKHAESQMQFFCYYGGRIYIKYAIMNFYGMKTLQSAAKGDHESDFYFEIHLVELLLNDSQYTKGRTWNLTDEVDKFKYNYRLSIVDNQPALYLKTIVDEKDKYEYILLNKAWDKHLSAQLLPSMMWKDIGENTFYNTYVLNTIQYVLINNVTRESLKILPGSSHLAPVYVWQFIPYKNLVYVKVFKKTEKTHSILKIDLKTKSNTEVKTFKDHDLYPLNPIMYLDQAGNTLYILDINDAKQLVIVDSIKL